MRLLQNASSLHASANTRERARDPEDQAAGYREDLKSLSPNEVARHAKEAALAGEEEVRLRRELEENQRREMPCMVKYQDTAAYKATDEQLRHRDALEKEIRQREADKIQREAWRLDAIGRARAQLAPPVAVTGPPRKRGAPPKYPWDDMEAKTYQLMGYHGPFSADDPVWDAQARLEEKLLKFC